jgi:tRNA 5-methylaminomethyl-2-thiouridine biosynthesis bifunctional protein
MPSAATPPWAAASHTLAPHWIGQNAWTVLDTAFGKGDRFLDAWHCWHTNGNRPRMLHWVGVVPEDDAQRLTTALAHAHHPHHALAATLAAQCYGLGRGFHRLLLEDGALSLTLCVGPLADMLAQQEMQADTVLADAGAVHADKWTIKALARHCKRGATLWLGAPKALDAAAWEAAGFVLQAAHQPRQQRRAEFKPHWTVRTSRRAAPRAFPAPGHCAVIGAGMAGASVARALALRGWSVTVLDAAAHPAAGASGLPLGLVVPHHSKDDSPRSVMSRAGTRLMLQHARARLVQGKDWNPSGVLELLVDANPLDAIEAEVLSQTDPAPTTGWTSPQAYAGRPGLWHPHAAWIKPQHLVAQWLDHPGIAFQAHAAVHTLERSGAQWLLRTADGAPLAQADAVVFANAHACAALLRSVAACMPDMCWVSDVQAKLQLLQAMHGTTSMGLVPEGMTAWPPFPVNGHGSFASGIPTAQGTAWFAGSTFRPQAPSPSELGIEHAENLAKLHTLLPQASADLAAQFSAGAVQAWQGTRCVTHDRLPLVGPLEASATPTLWLSAGMGARGLSFSALCAELLVAWMHGEPLPLENKLARGLDTRRPRRSRG